MAHCSCRYVDEFLQGCEVVAATQKLMDERNDATRATTCRELFTSNETYAGVCKSIVPDGVPFDADTGTPACADMTDSQMVELSGGALPSCTVAASNGFCTHAQFGEPVTAGCMVSCCQCEDMTDSQMVELSGGALPSCTVAASNGFCTHAQFGEPVTAGCQYSCPKAKLENSNQACPVKLGEAEPSACTATTLDKTAALFALAEANATYFPVLVGKYAVNKPCLFDGPQWVDGTRCTPLALRAIEVALPALDLLGSRPKSGCITTRAEGHCASIADTLCHSPDLAGESRLSTLMKLLRDVKQGRPGDVVAFLGDEKTRARTR